MMWIVQLALARRYTFIVMALFIMLMGAVTLSIMSTDIFPEINIPVVTVVWAYTGMSPDDMEKRIVTISERAYTTTVNDIEHMESQSMRGVSVIKVYFHPGAKVESAVAQITATSQTVLRVLPPGITPPFIIRYNASSVPVLQIGLSGKGLTEQQLNDYGLNFIRTQLATVQGASVPLPLGGKSRQIMVDLNPQALNAYGISPNDVVEAINTQNLILPAGSAKIGKREYDVKLNSSPEVADQINNFPLKQANGATVFIRDVAQIHDGFAVQSNIVRQDGNRGSLLIVLKAAGASTLDVVKRVKDALPRIAPTVPPELKMTPLFDQSVFVKSAIEGVLREGIIAATLTALMILIFLGSWRSTFIVIVSIPLAILTSIICLYLTGQTLNVMTLGGLGLAIGMLVDDATVEVENIHRNMHPSEQMHLTILNAARQVATPALVATLSICIVFFPVILVTGAAKSLFTPLAMAVVFAMLASYLLSRTLVPVLALYLMRPDEEADELSNDGAPTGARRRQSLFQRFHHGFNRQFDKLHGLYAHDLNWGLLNRGLLITMFVIFFAISGLLLPWIGQDFFPSVDAGQFRLHVRAPNGSRIEETEARFTAVEDTIRELVPARDRRSILDNIGLPNNGINLAFSDNATVGPSDGEILVALNPEHHAPTPGIVKELRKRLRERFPDMVFFFQPADIVTQILNFGLPAPLDVQVVGRNAKANYRLARQLEAQVSRVPGATDVHLHQITDAPQLLVNVDRNRAEQLGLSQRDVASNVLTSLSSSGQVAPNYWLNPKTGVNYTVAVQTPTHLIHSVANLEQIPITGSSTKTMSADNTGAGKSPDKIPQLLGNVGQVQLARTASVINHYNVQPTYDIYANVQGRDLGGVSSDINRIMARYPKNKLPRGTSIVLRGQAESMTSSFNSLGVGLVLAIILVYMLMVVNFQSWLDPLIIMMPTPAALSGILWILFVTQTTFSVPSLMGAIMSVGVATANSILLVSFANERLGAGDSPFAAAHASGETRLRPVLMTALAMILGMLPMALGLGEGGEQNAPLGRAVIGGLMVATFATLFLVPTMYSLLKRPLQKPHSQEATI